MSVLGRKRTAPPLRHFRESGNPADQRSTERIEAEVLREVPPFWITGLDQFQLLGPIPFLDPLLASDRRFHGRVLLEPDEQLDAVLLREPAHEAVTVLLDAGEEVGRDAGVERAVPLRREQIDGGREIVMHDFV
jgi:hypothetical protein